MANGGKGHHALARKITIGAAIIACALFLQACKEDTNNEAADRAANYANKQDQAAISAEPAPAGNEAEDRGKAHPEEVNPGDALFPVMLTTASGTRYGYIDGTGRTAIPPSYAYAEPFTSGGWASASRGSAFVLLDRSGKEWFEADNNAYVNGHDGNAIVVRQDDRSYLLHAGKPAPILETEDELGVPSEGRIRFAERAEDGEYVYGYRDYDGVIVIPAIFVQAEDYREGRAVVRTVDGRYSLLDREGQSVAVFPEDARYVNGYAEGTAVYQSSSSSRYGYLDEDGKRLIEAQYQYAEPFKNGLAIVSMLDESFSGTLSGVIDREGNVVIPFAYSSLYRLGNGWYALGATREGELQPTYRVADEKGTLLGNAVYESVWDAGERVVVYDGARSFFLDSDGRQDPTLPSVEGQPLLSLAGGFVQVIGQGRTQILSTSGEVAWAETRSVELPGGIAIIEHAERDGQSRTVYYPQLSGIGDAAQEAKLNAAFREEAARLLEPYRNPDASVSPEELDWLADTTLSYDYELAGRVGRVLIIKQTGYEYNSGAAHGMPWQSYAHIDQVSGLTYRLADLLTPDGMHEIERRIRADAGDDPEVSGYDLSDWEGLSGADLFAIEEGALVVYFSPYEIAPYAAGFPEFRYPLSELGEWIDQEGEFWRALERE